MFATVTTKSRVQQDIGTVGNRERQTLIFARKIIDQTLSLSQTPVIETHSLVRFKLPRPKKDPGKLTWVLTDSLPI